MALSISIMHGVSVIIPCWNAGNDLREAVQSVRPAAGPVPYEIIVVDDASTDRSTREVLSTIEQIPHTKLISLTENKGQSYARNVALSEAVFDFIVPLDADDVLTPASGYIPRGAAKLKNSNSTTIVYCDTEKFGADSGKPLLETFNESRFLYRNTIHAFGMYRREEALRVGGYNESIRYAEDWDLWISLLNGRLKSGEDRDVCKLDMIGHKYRKHTHGQNVCATRKPPVQEIYRYISDRSPEIYRHHYPDIAREDLPAQMAELAANKWRHIFACAADPVTLIRETGKSLMKGIPRALSFG